MKIPNDLTLLSDRLSDSGRCPEPVNQFSGSDVKTEPVKHRSLEMNDKVLNSLSLSGSGKHPEPVRTTTKFEYNPLVLLCPISNRAEPGGIPGSKLKCVYIPSKISSKG